MKCNERSNWSIKVGSRNHSNTGEQSLGSRQTNATCNGCNGLDATISTQLGAIVNTTHVMGDNLVTMKFVLNFRMNTTSHAHWVGIHHGFSHVGHTITACGRSTSEELSVTVAEQLLELHFRNDHNWHSINLYCILKLGLISYKNH